MNDRQLDEWTTLMASELNPLTSYAALDEEALPPKRKGSLGCAIAFAIGLALGLLALGLLF